MENPTSELDFVSQNAKSETSSSAFYGGIQRLLLWKGNICFKKSFEETYINMWERCGIFTPLLKELPEEVGIQAPETEAIQLPWLRQ